MLQSDYCKNFVSGSNCKYVNSHVSKRFCENICKSNHVIGVSYMRATTVKRNVKLVNTVTNFASAVERFAKSGFKLVDEKTFNERTICCDDCSSDGKCPFCGCHVSIKAKLVSEQCCPNPTTYTNLKTYPERNFWEVCGETVSVIIPSRNEPLLLKTIEAVKSSAAGNLDIIVVLDGYNTELPKDVRVLQFDKPVGKRASVNQAVKLALGNYIFCLDAHCNMSNGWDTKLKLICVDKTMVTCCIKPLDNDFNYKIGSYNHVRINDDLVCKWWNKPTKDKKEVTMATTGCGYMIRTNFFDSNCLFSDKLGDWGFMGEETSLNVACSGGKIVLRSDVICGHVFGTNKDFALYTARYTNQGDFLNWVMEKYGEKAFNYIRSFENV